MIGSCRMAAHFDNVGSKVAHPSAGTSDRRHRFVEAEGRRSIGAVAREILSVVIEPRVPQVITNRHEERGRKHQQQQSRHDFERIRDK